MSFLSPAEKIFRRNYSHKEYSSSCFQYKPSLLESQLESKNCALKFCLRVMRRAAGLLLPREATCWRLLATGKFLPEQHAEDDADGASHQRT